MKFLFSILFKIRIVFLIFDGEMVNINFCTKLYFLKYLY